MPLILVESWRRCRDIKSWGCATRNLHQKLLSLLLHFGIGIEEVRQDIAWCYGRAPCSATRNIPAWAECVVVKFTFRLGGWYSWVDLEATISDVPRSGLGRSRQTEAQPAWAANL